MRRPGSAGRRWSATRLACAAGPRANLALRERPARRLIVTADDFGLHEGVNEAVADAHQNGILTSASLMVAAPAAADAVARARALPRLAVGLHLVLTDGRPCLAPADLPALVADNGCFDDNMPRAGCRFFFSRRARRQLAAEIEAQFAAFAATGLMLDHVNAHKHFHLHPTVLRLILEIGGDYGLKSIRLPHEPLLPSLRLTPTRPLPRAAGALALAPWRAHMRRRMRRAGLSCCDQVFGIATSGHTTAHALNRILLGLPTGLSEVYLHPATQNHFSPSMPNYDHRGEWAALINPAIQATLRRLAIRATTFAAQRGEPAICR